MDLNQFVPSQQSALTMDSAESTAAAAARAPNGAARDIDDDDDDAVPEVAACISTMLDRGGSVESHRLFLARRTALEMLRDRGYAVPEDELARTLPEFRAWWEDKPELERLAFSTALASDPSNKVGFSPSFQLLTPYHHRCGFRCSCIRV
jgi:DNA-directed RNA polymerase I, II, and III subunit RPABC1